MDVGRLTRDYTVGSRAFCTHFYIADDALVKGFIKTFEINIPAVITDLIKLFHGIFVVLYLCKYYVINTYVSNSNDNGFGVLCFCFVV